MNEEVKTETNVTANETIIEDAPKSETYVRRNRPGTSMKEWCNWTEEELEDMESTLAVQQFIQQLIKEDHTKVDSILKSPEQQDELVWKYEHLRQFCMELNLICVKLQNECTPATCTQMTATEQWIFLCAAHKNPKECSAIDYTRHTLDGAACLLNSNRYFPSRVNIKDSSVQKLASVCRRIYRIFSHAYFHHRPIYDQFESETSLCERFTSFVTKYDLMTSDTLIVPINTSESELNNLEAKTSPTSSPPAAVKSETSVVAGQEKMIESEA